MPVGSLVVAGRPTYRAEQLGELPELLLGERAEREVGPHQVSGGDLDELTTGGGDLGQDRAAVVGMRTADDEPVGLESLHDGGDRGGVYLESLAHLAQGQRAARGEAEQHQRLVAGEGQAVRLEDRVEP